MKKSRNEKRLKRKRHIRKSLLGTPSKPRLSVFKSSSHIYAQIIDDVNGVTLVSAGSAGKTPIKGSGNIKGAQEIGRLIAEKAKEKKIENVVFDRSGFRYHGRVKALAEAAREKGLKF